MAATPIATRRDPNGEAAQLGRDLGDAGAPTLVGLVSGAGGLAAGLVALGAPLLVATAAAFAPAGRASTSSD
jgi:hypothetical protein